MNISNCKATVGLNGRVTPTNGGASGSILVGSENQMMSLTGATKIHSFEAVIVGDAASLVVPMAPVSAVGSTAWTAGAAQVETATAAGTITLAGNATVVVTAAGMTGSPKTFSVAVALNDTAAAWAGKVRTALAADAAVAAMFTVGGTNASITLTRKALGSHAINGGTVNVYADNDATLNIALDNGTCTGITTAANSANTTSGVATNGVYAPKADGTDVFGEAVSLTTLLAGSVVNQTPAGGGEIAVVAGPATGIAFAGGGALLALLPNYSVLTDLEITQSNLIGSKVQVTLAGT